MTPFNVPLLLCVLLPLSAVAQTPTPELNSLRSRAQIDGSVQVRVTTRAVAAVATQGGAPTSEQRVAIERAQHKLLIQLVSNGLVVGNEITVQSDRSFTMRVLPEALDILASAVDVADLRSSADERRGGIP